MINFNQLKQIHLEITNNCQASCPMCTRNIHGGLKNPNINKRGWTLDDYKKIISPEVIEQIENVYFCGNYGDPLLNDQLLEMVEYTTSIKKDIKITIHTNGSLRSKEWWTNLAKVMPNSHRVVFAIDGLEDTQTIYRIGTSYEKIIENAKAFIDAGGIAEWAYIRFKHNEHQVEEARHRAIDIGFEYFTMKDSSRWLMEPKFKVLDKQGNIDYYLEPSQHSTIKIVDTDIIGNYKSILEKTEINCYAKHVKEVYIDSYGHVFPCCWLAMIPYHPKDLEHELHEIREAIYAEYFDLVKSLGGIDALDVKKKPLKDIINSDEYQNVWNSYWTDKKLITCGRACGIQPELFSTPQDQFTSREEL
jgi:MoaA/NifB/PqqE/SkfB family radical SAM enzyme